MFARPLTRGAIGLKGRCDTFGRHSKEVCQSRSVLPAYLLQCSVLFAQVLNARWYQTGANELEPWPHAASDITEVR